jgi:two-component system, LytTR family, sensor kinase
LHYVQTYLRLEQARFRDRLTVRVQVDPDVLQTVVPVLSLRPLVENAVKHGEANGTGLHNVDRRLRATFEENYGLEIETEPDRGTTVVLAVPKFRVGVRAA